MSLLQVEGLTVRFGGAAALDALDLEVPEGAFVALLGGSGSGKSTLLRTIAGFVAPAAGRILLGGVDLAPLPPERRPLHMMFQSYALFPHMSVADNVGYGLRRAGAATAERIRRVGAALEMVGLEAFARRRPAALSGGQQQRVALARALILRPRLLLLDEPLGALDAALRERTGAELRALQRATGSAFLMVTHDQAEALALADRVAVLEQGRVIQQGTPRELWDRPATRFVAGFLGAANIIEGVALADGGVDCPALPATLRPAVPHGKPPGSPVALALRAERIGFGDEGLPAVVTEATYRGGASLLTLRTSGGAVLRALWPEASGPAPEHAVTLSWEPSALVPLA
ncbi:putrescine transport system ATP-binding protein [Humitalea rosea]|uniref:Putrescine transport system ATP-binding protein n=1 Tax=Humitalea rosea TaxID=990373 RepID=A0A2W7HV69_9PROT|nr:ABC transporter ATP-binding protein [Humitalea rosea]PZW38536.1 putrescine transport system ATP-binding protein [Humitalea rosea]